MTSTLLRTVGCNEVASRRTIRAMPLTPQEIAARIRRARELRKPEPWSQFDLAIALGVSPSTIYRWEKGKLPSVNELFRLEELLGQPPGYLTEPPEQRAELSDLVERLDEIVRLQAERAETAERVGEAALENLAAIHDRLTRIEEQLAIPSARQEAQAETPQ